MPKNKGVSSPTPPPLPNEPPPLPTEQPPLPTEQPPLPKEQPPDQPIAALGEDDDDDQGEDERGRGSEDEEEGGKDSGEAPGEGSTADDADVGESSSQAKGKEVAKGEEGDKPQPWQAVWSAEQNAWYFWNTETGAVTWTNPLQPDATAQPEQPPLPPGPPPKAAEAPRPNFASGAGIDPDLAYLLPPDQRGTLSSDPTAQSASFNARTGKFSVDNSYRFDHLDEYNRQKRMSEHYFDLEGWEKQRQEEHKKRRMDEAAGITKDTRVTKQDMERFKKKKAEQKWRKQAWLRD